MSLWNVSNTPRYCSPANARCCTLVLTLFRTIKKSLNRRFQQTHTSSGYITAHEVTPAREPQQNGTNDGGIGSHGGVEPCSPEESRPMMYRNPSYSKKYRAVPVVSRTATRMSKHHRMRQVDSTEMKLEASV